MNRFLRLSVAALALALVSFVASSAFAYTYTFTCGPSWPSLPVNYYINQNGSGDLSFSEVESVVADSFEVWGDPCCSKFDASYQGTTSLTATNNQGRVVLSWTEDGWNPQWGSVNQTIGITFSQVRSDCAIIQAPILFNGVGFRFSTNGTATDIQSIATHEIGHLLGLGHSKPAPGRPGRRLLALQSQLQLQQRQPVRRRRVLHCPDALRAGAVSEQQRLRRGSRVRRRLGRLHHPTV